MQVNFAILLILTPALAFESDLALGWKWQSGVLSEMAIFQQLHQWPVILRHILTLEGLPFKSSASIQILEGAPPKLRLDGD